APPGDACSLCFFFFQAEDGIRDFHVTGVQTCALPISWIVMQEVPTCCHWVSGAPVSRSISRRYWRIRKYSGMASPAFSGHSYAEIGRASCRERVEGSVGDGAGVR